MTIDNTDATCQTRIRQHPATTVTITLWTACVLLLGIADMAHAPANVQRALLTLMCLAALAVGGLTLIHMYAPRGIDSFAAACATPYGPVAAMSTSHWWLVQALSTPGQSIDTAQYCLAAAAPVIAACASLPEAGATNWRVAPHLRNSSPLPATPHHRADQLSPAY